MQEGVTFKIVLQDEAPGSPPAKPAVPIAPQPPAAPQVVKPPPAPPAEVPETVKIGGQKVDLADPKQKALVEFIQANMPLVETPEPIPAPPVQPAAPATTQPAAPAPLQPLAVKPEPVPFDAAAEARKQIDAERQRGQVKAARENIEQGPGVLTHADLESPKFGEKLTGIMDRMSSKGPQALTGMAQTIGGPAMAEMIAPIAESIGAAAGPVGIAFVGAKVAAETMKAGMDRTTEAIHELGDTTTKIASNDHLGIFTARIDDVGEVLEGIPGSFGAAGSAFRMVIAPLKVFTATVEAFNERSKDLAVYSGPISQAEANAEIAAMRADIRETRALEDSLASLVESRSQLDNQLREIMLPIKTALADVVSTLLQKIVQILEDNKVPLHIISESVASLLMILKAWFQKDEDEALVQLVSLVDHIKTILKQQADEATASNFDEQLDKIFATKAPNWARQPEPNPKAGMLNIPAFNNI